MKSRTPILAALLAAVGMLGLSACAPDDQHCAASLPSEHSKLVWPAAPEKARIAHVGYLQDNTNCKGTTSETALALSYPKAIAISPNDLVYVSDRMGVRVFNPKASTLTAFAPEAKNARGMAIASDGRVFIADNERRSVLVYSADNKSLGEIGAGEFQNPQGVAIDSKRGRLYVADTALHEVRSYTLDGKYLSSLKSTPEASIGAPTQVAINSHGEVFIVNQSIPRIVVFDSEGKFARAFGPEGLLPGQFVRPKGIAIDSEDHVYVTDAAFDNIQIFDRQGQLLLFLGQGGNDRGEFNLPAMMAIDSRDRIFVAEFGNHRVQVLQYLK